MPDGIKVAVFYAKLHNGLRPCSAPANPKARPIPVALRAIGRRVDRRITLARLANAA